MFASTSLISRLFAHKSLTSIFSIQKKHFSMHSYTATKPGGGQVVRPLSPHLTVYVFKENMLTSIMFRGCGVLMFVGLAGLGGVSLMSDKKFPAYIYQLQQMPALNFLVKFFVAFPLSYHLLGGLRHIAWDHIIFHNLESARTSGLAAIGVSAAIAAVASVSQSENLE